MAKGAAEATPELHEILESLRSGRIDVMQAQKMLSLHSVVKLGEFARIDPARAQRRGVPEVVLAHDKKPGDLLKIAEAMLEKSGRVIISRMRPRDKAAMSRLASRLGVNMDEGRRSTSVLLYTKAARRRATVGILCAGTSDIGIAEEARLVCSAMGCGSICRYDVGVAGMHRLFPAVREVIKADAGALVAVAGMEGALATVVSSMVDIPVIGVPSSVGYGYGGRGVAALASMLQSCALGMTVVNIDNGIGAGAAAANIALRTARHARK